MSSLKFRGWSSRGGLFVPSLCFVDEPTTPLEGMIASQSLELERSSRVLFLHIVVNRDSRTGASRLGDGCLDVSCVCKVCLADHDKSMIAPCE